MNFETSMEQLERLHTGGADYHEEMMDIIKREIENGNYKMLSHLENVNSEILCKFLIAAGEFWWLVNKPCHFQYLLHILGNRYKECVPFFANQPEWNCMPPSHCAKIMATILCLDHKTLKDPKCWNPQDRLFFDASRSLVEKLVIRTGMTPPRIANEGEIITKCAEMISSLKFFRHKSDTNQIICNLNQFPTLEALLKDSVVEMTEKRETNWLVRMLGGGMREGKRLHLSKIENVLRELQTRNINRSQRLIGNLKNNTQTLDTLAEINLMAILLERSFELVGVNVDVPCVGQSASDSKSKDFDILAKFGNTNLYVEVFNHRNDMIDDLLECVHEPTKNIGGKIYEKYGKFRDLPDPTVAMLAIQTESSSRDVKEFLTQSEKKCTYERLSAVFLFSKFDSDDLILNPNAASPLPSSIISALSYTTEHQSVNNLQN